METVQDAMIDSAWCGPLASRTEIGRVCAGGREGQLSLGQERERDQTRRPTHVTDSKVKKLRSWELFCEY